MTDKPWTETLDEIIEALEASKSPCTADDDHASVDCVGCNGGIDLMALVDEHQERLIFEAKAAGDMRETLRDVMEHDSTIGFVQNMCAKHLEQP